MQADFGLPSPGSGRGVAFVAHVGGFVFGVLVTGFLYERGRIGASMARGIDPA